MIQGLGMPILMVQGWAHGLRSPCLGFHPSSGAPEALCGDTDYSQAWSVPWPSSFQCEEASSPRTSEAAAADHWEL